MNALAEEYPESYRKAARRSYLVSYYRKAFEKVYRKSKKYITDTILRCWYYQDMQDKAIERGEFETVVVITGKIKECVHILKKYQDEQYFRRQGESMKDEISDEMVRGAKGYPFEKLIPLNQHMKACCPFHGEKTPSFSVKNNRGHCFGCGWKGDTVQFIMDRDKIGFRDAVKKLC